MLVLGISRLQHGLVLLAVNATNECWESIVGNKYFVIDSWIIVGNQMLGNKILLLGTNVGKFQSLKVQNSSQLLFCSSVFGQPGSIVGKGTHWSTSWDGCWITSGLCIIIPSQSYVWGLTSRSEGRKQCDQVDFW